MKPLTHSKTILASVALAGLMSGSALRLHASTGAGNGPNQLSANSSAGMLADDSSMGKHDCKGQNSCKGQGGCKSSDNGCKGKNSCKGKGGCATNKPASS
jgi:hypothetical protein